MTPRTTLIVIAALGVGLLTGLARAQEQPALKDEKERLSYALGMDVGRQFAKLDISVDPVAFAKGLEDALSARKTVLTEEEARATVAAMQAELKRRQWQARTTAGEDSKKAGKAFLAENGTREGVVTLPSGLQYKIIRAGSARKPTDTDTVEVNYRGALINGTEFDSSYRTGKPATFKVAAVIPGWMEALKRMPAGSTWQLFIPPQLAYGERGAGSGIGPDATLVFEVELLAIK
jgi:FKBP-type peptidyl-prolyl cis-trans isomerase